MILFFPRILPHVYQLSFLTLNTLSDNLQVIRPGGDEFRLCILTNMHLDFVFRLQENYLLLRVPVCKMGVTPTSRNG